MSSKRRWVWLFCLTACDGNSGDEVGRQGGSWDGGVVVDEGEPVELPGDSSEPPVSEPDRVPDDALTSSDAGTPEDGGDVPGSDPSIAPTSAASPDGLPPALFDGGAPGLGADSDGDAGTMAPRATDLVEAGSGGASPEPVVPAEGAAAPLGDAATPVFELPAEERCTGVEFIDPVQACLDLGGLSLVDPVLVTDEDGEWNPGDVATLQLDVAGEPRESGEVYVSPAVVAVFDVESGGFASVQWKTFEWFGVMAGDQVPHELELTLAADAPRGATVWLYLEPAVSGGDVTACDCPEVEVTGLTLAFQVQ